MVCTRSAAVPLHSAVHNIHHCLHIAVAVPVAHHTAVGSHIQRYILQVELGSSWVLRRIFCYCDDDEHCSIWNLASVCLSENVRDGTRKKESTYRMIARRTSPMKIRIPAKTQRPQRYHAEWQFP